MGGAAVDDEVMPIIRRMTRLKSLRLYDCNVTALGLEQLKDHPSLRTVSIAITERKPPEIMADRKISVAAVEALATLDLEWLRFSGYEFGDSTIAALGRMQGLTGVGLDNANLRDSHVVVLAGLSNLRMIALGNNPEITDAGIAALKQCKTLETLGVDGTGDSFMRAARYRKVLPGINVLTLESDLLFGEAMPVEGP